MNYVINLDSRMDRWGKMEQQLKEQKDDLCIKRFSAIRPSWMNLDHYIKRMERDFLVKLITGHISHGLGTIGVFDSQHTLWKECAERNEPMMIFEDDVTFQTNELKKELDLILNEIQHEFDMIVFFPNMKIFGITKYTKYTYRTSRPMFGAYAYYLHPDFARKTLSRLENIIRPFDIQVKDIYTNTDHRCYLSKKNLVTTPVSITRDSNIIQKRTLHKDLHSNVYTTIHHFKCKTPPFIFYNHKPKFNYRLTFQKHECKSIIIRYKNEIIFHLEHGKTESKETMDCSLEEKQFGFLFHPQKLV